MSNSCLKGDFKNQNLNLYFEQDACRISNSKFQVISTSRIIVIEGKSENFTILRKHYFYTAARCHVHKTFLQLCLEDIHAL